MSFLWPFTATPKVTMSLARASVALSEEQTDEQVAPKLSVTPESLFHCQETKQLIHVPLTDDNTLLEFASIVAPASDSGEPAPFVVPKSGVCTMRATIIYDVPFDLPVNMNIYVLSPVVSNTSSPSKYTEVVKKPPTTIVICANGQMTFQQSEQALLTKGDLVSWELVASDPNGVVLSNTALIRGKYARFTYLFESSA
jgi:hypothetical protein